MPPSFPCLNPTCPHTFAPESVKGVASLACPRCGTIFQFRAAVSPKPAPKPPVPRPTASKPRPVVTKSAPRPPLPPPMPPSPSLPSEADVALKPRRSEWHWLWVGPLLVALTGGAIWSGILALRSVRRPPDNTADVGRHEDKPANGPEKEKDGEKEKEKSVEKLPAKVDVVQPSKERPAPAPGDAYVRLPSKGEAWKDNADLVKLCKVRWAYRRSKPGCVALIHYQDFEKRTPTDAELIDFAVEHLRSTLDDLEWSVMPRDDKTKLGDRPALLVEFEGKERGIAAVAGQCLMATADGVAYWFITWGQADKLEDVADETAKLRKSFAISFKRDGWKETPRPTVAVAAGTLPFEIVYAADIWKPDTAVDKFDKSAKLVLLGMDPAAAARPAVMQALLLPKPKEAGLKAAVAEARDYLSKQKDVGMPMPVTNRTGADQEEDRTVNEVMGHVSRLRFFGAEKRERYFVLWVVPTEETLLVMQCECDWPRRAFWDAEFRELIAAFRKKK